MTGCDGMTTKDLFIVAHDGDEACQNWLICFGKDANDDHNWYITTNHIHGSDLHLVSGGAKFDAELVCRLLNENYQKQIEVCEWYQFHDHPALFDACNGHMTLAYGVDNGYKYCPLCGRRIVVVEAKR